MNIDLIVAFIFVIVTFSIMINYMDIMTYSSINSNEFEYNFLSSISRSYEILSLISGERDNEVSLVKLNGLAPSNVSLSTPNGYLYGGKMDCLYVKRAVYIIELEDVGFVEVC